MRTVLLAVLLVVPLSLAAPFPCDRQEAFVRHLAGRGEWYRAVTETYRLAWECPSSPTADELDLALARLHLRAGQPGLARRHLYAWLASPRPALQTLQARILLCSSYEAEHDWVNALHSLDRLPGLPSELLAVARLKRAELLIKTFHPGRDEELRLLRQEIPPRYTNELRLLEDRDAASRRVPARSLLVSDLLGVLPGMNLVYAGRPLQGLATLASHTALAGLIAWAVSTERWTLAAVLAPTALTWYTYNFTAGREAVRAFNEESRRRFAVSWSLPLALP